MARRTHTSFQQSLSVDIDSDGELQIKCHPMFARELEKIIRDIASMARKIVAKDHSKTRKLERSIQPYAGRSARSHVRRVGPHLLVGTVTAGSARAPYAKYVHEGTLPHIIRARQPNGSLSFVTDKRNGRTHYFRKSRRLMTEGELDDLELTGVGDEYYYAVRRRNRRYKDWEAGRESFMHDSDADVVVERTRHKYSDRKVVVDQVRHPGYKGHRFLNQAAAIVVSRNGGIVRGTGHRFGRNNATLQRW